jgi:hypothetical protein
VLVVRVIGIMEPGGALRLSAGLRAHGVRTHFLAGDASAAGLAMAREHGFAVEAFTHGAGLQWYPSEAFAEWLAPRLADADLVHAHMFGAWWAAALAAPEEVPVVASEHNCITWPDENHDDAAQSHAIAHALPVTSNATRSRGSRLCANSSNASGLVAIRPPERSRPSARIATSQKSRWTSSATALTSSSSPSLIPRENRWANDIDGSALAAQPGKSQGRPLKRPGSKPIVQNGLPNLRSPRKPLVPVSRTYARRRTPPEPSKRAVSCPEKRQRPKAPHDPPRVVRSRPGLFDPE